MFTLLRIGNDESKKYMLYNDETGVAFQVGFEELFEHIKKHGIPNNMIFPYIRACVRQQDGSLKSPCFMVKDIPMDNFSGLTEDVSRGRTITFKKGMLLPFRVRRNFMNLLHDLVTDELIINKEGVNVHIWWNNKYMRTATMFMDLVYRLPDNSELYIISSSSTGTKEMPVSSVVTKISVLADEAEMARSQFMRKIILK